MLSQWMCLKTRVRLRAIIGKLLHSTSCGARESFLMCRRCWCSFSLKFSPSSNLLSSHFSLVAMLRSMLSFTTLKIIKWQPSNLWSPSLEAITSSSTLNRRIFDILCFETYWCVHKQWNRSRDATKKSEFFQISEEQKPQNKIYWFHSHFEFSRIFRRGNFKFQKTFFSQLSYVCVDAKCLRDYCRDLKKIFTLMTSECVYLHSTSHNMWTTKMIEGWVKTKVEPSTAAESNSKLKTSTTNDSHSHFLIFFWQWTAITSTHFSLIFICTPPEIKIVQNRGK